MGKITVISTKMTKKEKQEREAFIKKGRDDSFALMNPALQQFAQKLEGALNKWVDGTYKRTWELGENLVGVRDNVEKYGADPMNKLGQYLERYGSNSLMQKAMHFFTAFDKIELEDLLQKRMKISGSRLTWAHVEQFLTIDDKKKRVKFIDETCDSDWTVAELATAIRGAGIKGDSHAGGRPVRIPATITGKLENFAKIGYVITRNEKDMWSHAEHGFISTIEKLDATKITAELVNKFEADITIADKMLASIEAMKEQLEKARDLACTRMKEQQKKEEEAQEEAEAKAVEKDKKKKGKDPIESETFDFNEEEEEEEEFDESIA